MMDEEIVKTMVSEEAATPAAGNRRLESYMKITAIATSLIVLSILFLLLYFIRGIVLIFALAFLASYIISPAVRFFERRRINRVLVVSVLYVAFVAAVVAGIVILLPMLWGELKELQTNIQTSLSDPAFGENVTAKLNAIRDRLAKTFPLLEDVDLAAQLKIDKGVSGAASWIRDYLGEVMRAITSYSSKLIWMIIVMILIPFVTFFLLKDGGAMKRSAMKVIPGRYSETTLELLQKIDRQIGRYIRGRIAESLILSVLTIIGLRILSIKYYLVIGGIAGFANLIPYIGPVGIAIPAVILAGYQYGVFHMVITSIFFGSLQVIDNAILVPLVVGKSVDLHPVATIFVIFVGAQLLGFLGMVIAVPVTSIFVATSQALYKELGSSSTPA